MDEGTPNITQMVASIVTSLVDEPSKVEVQSREEDDALVIEVKVAQEDAGKVIGRQGRIIKSIRTLARAASAYAGGGHVEVEILG
ncbi:MAG: KH domain-containing protein [Coriobacteriales bacterium]|jgi:predicted RNA-binding protein YlqC (UPF0109 family)|nr:KH domain-containing protein [Coriobacteriales bacterium]